MNRSIFIVVICLVGCLLLIESSYSQFGGVVPETSSYQPEKASRRSSRKTVDEKRQVQLATILASRPEITRQTLNALLRQDGTDAQGIVEALPTNIAKTMGNAAHPVFIEILTAKKEETPERKALVLALLVHQAYTVDNFDYENVLSKLSTLAATPDLNEEFRQKVEKTIAAIVCSTDLEAREMRNKIFKLQLNASQSFISSGSHQFNAQPVVPGALPQTNTISVQPAPEVEVRTYSLPSTGQPGQN